MAGVQGMLNELEREREAWLSSSVVLQQDSPALPSPTRACLAISEDVFTFKTGMGVEGMGLSEGGVRQAARHPVMPKLGPQRSNSQPHVHSVPTCVLSSMTDTAPQSVIFRGHNSDCCSYLQDKPLVFFFLLKIIFIYLKGRVRNRWGAREGRSSIL